MTKHQTRALTDAERAARDKARGYTDADVAAVLDNPEWTDEELKSARPFAEVFPELAASIHAEDDTMTRRVAAEPRLDANRRQKSDGEKTGSK